MHEGRLVGRDPERSFVEARLAADPPQAVLLGGQAGIGKTRLARELAGSEGPDRASIWITGTTGDAGIPGAAVLRFVDSLGAGPAEIVATALGAIRASGATRVVVDDAHRLDPLAALTIQHLVLSGSPAVLLTARSGERLPEELATLVDAGIVERLDLLPLASTETAALAGDLLGREVAPPTAEALHRSCAGNPLYLRELLRDARVAGTLHLADERWQWEGGIGRATHLRSIVGRRVAAEGRAERAALQALALVEPLEVADLDAVAPGLDVDAAADAGLVELRHNASGTVVHLGHPLLGEVARADLDAEGLHTVRRRLLAALDPTRDVRTALHVARLLFDEGDATDPAALLRSTVHAVLLGAYDLGVALATLVLERAGPHPEAQLLLGEAHLSAGREALAMPALEAALIDDLSDAQRLRAVQSLQHCLHRAGRTEEVQRVIDNARPLVRSPEWLAVLDCQEVQELMFAGRSAEGLRRGEEILAANDDPRVQLRLVSSLGMALVLHGRTADGLAFTERLLPVALAHRDELPLAPAWVMNTYALGLMLAGRLDDADRLVDMLRGMAPTADIARPGAQHPMLDAFEARVALARGDAARAAGLLRGSVAGVPLDSPNGLARWVRCLLAEALALLGEHEAAAEALADADRATTIMHLYDPDSGRAAARAHAQCGEVGRAAAALEAVAAAQEVEGQHGTACTTLHDLLRLTPTRGIANRLAEQARAADGLLAPAYLAHADAVRDGGPEAHERAAEAFAGLGLRLDAAELLAVAARRFDEAGLRARAGAARRAADGHRAACPGVHTPALADPVAAVELTQREREVVLLAAQGLSNREIADRLFVSVRTAEGHLYRASTKLGVTDRAELAAALDPAPNA